MAKSETPLFPNITQTTPRSPKWLWEAGRLALLGLTLALLIGLVSEPMTTLTLTWGVLVPLLPILIFIAPGVWRNLCPMATLNQIPRRLGLGLQRPLRGDLRSQAYVIAFALFFILAPVRLLQLDYDPFALLLLLLALLALALIGGFVFQGKAGWCGSFCPLGPLERLYGQSPLIKARDRFCEPCIGCQKHCYDYNPEVAQLADLHDKDHGYISDRKFFFAALPGLIHAYFTLPSPPVLTSLALVEQFVISLLVSVGAYHVIETVSRVSTYKLNILYAALGLNLYYFYRLPLMVDDLHTLTGLRLDVAAPYAGNALLILLSLLWVWRAMSKEDRYISALLSRKSVRVGASARLSALKEEYRDQG